MLSPVALAYLKYYPEPNTPPLGANGFQNYVSNFLAADTYNNELGRIDYNMSDRSHLFFDMRHNDRVQNKGNYFNNVATGTNLARENWGATVDEVYTLNPTTFVDMRLNFTRMNEAHGEPSEGFNPTTLGLPVVHRRELHLPGDAVRPVRQLRQPDQFPVPGRQQRIARSIAVVSGFRRGYQSHGQATP